MRSGIREILRASLLIATGLAMMGLVLAPGAAQAQSAADPVFGSRTDQPDGSVAMTVGRRLPTPWDAKLGFDASLAPDAPIEGAGAQDAAARRSSGAIWGSISGGAPFLYDKTAITARVAPDEEQGRVAAALSRTVPVADGVSVTLRDELSVTQALPGGDGGATWNVDRSLSLNLGHTGTSLSAGLGASSAEGQWHNRLSLEQKIVGPLNLWTSVTDPGTAASNKSIGAGFKHRW